MQQETIKQDLNRSKSRYEKGMEIYKSGKVSINGDGLFKVCGYYEVDTGKMKCTCPDYKTRKESCKHIFASLLFTKNRGKQTIEDLNGFANGSNGKSDSQSKSELASKDTSNKSVEGRYKDFDRQSTISPRLATINSAIEALKTHRKPIELADILTLASQLEAWALGK